MKTELLKCTGFVIGLIFVFSLFPQSAAAVDWEDNFDDGNYDGWTVAYGEWRVEWEEKWLETYLGAGMIHRISHPSDVVVGTWSFDHYHGYDAFQEYTTVWFLTNGTDTPDENYGYGLRMRQNDIYLIRLRGEWDQDMLISGAVYTPDEPYDKTWTHYDITRNSTGAFHVYVNATTDVAEPVFTVVDTEYSYSERLIIDVRGDVSHCIDNIVVDDNITITPRAPTTPTPTATTTTEGPTPLMDPILLVAGAGVAGIVIVAAVVFMRRR